MKTYHYFLNGKILPADQAFLSVRDIGILRGFGIFDFFRTYKGKPLLMEKYLERFHRSAQAMNLPLKHAVDELKNIISELLEKNDSLQAGIRLILTGGISPDAFSPAQPNFAILVEPLHFPSDEVFQKGIKLITHQYQREWSRIKTTNYLSAILLQPKIKAEKAFDVLFHFNREVREVSRSNVFLIKDQKVITPEQHILLGVTRKKVIELASQHYQVEERTISMDEIATADEFFMTGTTKKVLPVVQIDQHRIHEGKPGPVTRHLMKIFADFEESIL
ncbi:MAG: aminotransferase class IV [Candidatus Cyclobacteriaceae bacterium M3_2C_046]